MALRKFTEPYIDPRLLTDNLPPLLYEAASTNFFRLYPKENLTVDQLTSMLTFEYQSDSAFLDPKRSYFEFRLRTVEIEADGTIKKIPPATCKSIKFTN